MFSRTVCVIIGLIIGLTSWPIFAICVEQLGDCPWWLCLFILAMVVMCVSAILSLLITFINTFNNMFF